MGASIRCERCLKGISNREGWTVLDGAAYHPKCAQRAERAAEQNTEPLVIVSGLYVRLLYKQ